MFSAIWDFFKGVGRSLLVTITSTIITKAKAIAEDKDLVNLALQAVQAAATEGLTGEKAWTTARNALTASLKEAGRDLGNCTIDTILQTTYDAWKNTVDTSAK